MSSGFLKAFARLPGTQQRAVSSLISRFEADPKSPGLNFEALQGARDPKMRSLRVDLKYRAIVHAPAKGSTHVLLWVDKHDDAYRWAEAHECSVNPETGALQIYVPSEIDQRAVGEPVPEPSGPAGPFASLKSRELMRLGVPRTMVNDVRRMNAESDLEEAKYRLPVEAYDGLFLYLAGEPYDRIIRGREVPDEPVDVGDVERALKRDDSRASFAVIHSEMELEAMLNAPLEDWRIFLHPTQRKLAERNWNGPVRLLGAAGTGKTVVAIHRASWLARQSSCRKVLLVTFTKNLAADIRTNLARICSRQELKRIEVTNLDAWVVGLLKRKGIDVKIAFGGDHDAWRHALELRPVDLDLPERFYETEWRQVVQANGVSSVDGYKRVSRVGRGVRLSRRDRIKVWRVFEEYKLQLIARGVKELDDVYRDAYSAIESSGPDLGYSSVIVDEAQDLGIQAFRLIRLLVPAGTNDLFITGDCHQRIYGRRVILGRCGINIRGRSRKLLLNYRTTEQTRAWAARLLEGREIDDLDGGRDDNSRVRSLTRGPEPIIRHFDTEDQHSGAIVRYLQDLESSGGQLADVCVVARSRSERDAIASQIQRSGLQVVIVDRDGDDRSIKGVRAATMHRVKGLEFEYMVLASVNAGLVPPAKPWISAQDDSEREQIETLERALLYVGASRAKKAVSVLSYGKASHLLSE